MLAQTRVHSNMGSNRTNALHARVEQFSNILDDIRSALNAGFV
jgi:hypothetical protein